MATTFVQGLRSGVETRWPFERSSAVVYSIIAVEILLSVVFHGAGGFYYPSYTVLKPAIWIPDLLIAGWLARRIGHSGIAGSAETIGILYLQGAAIVPLLFPLTAFSGPYADDMLVSWDRALGFDWIGFAMLFRNSQFALDFLNFCYWSFGWQALIILPALFYLKLETRAWRMVTAAAIALAITLAIYPFVIAVGAFPHFGISEADYPLLKSAVPWGSGRVIHMVKDQGVREVSRHIFTAFISFPSYHGASALIFAWAAWPTRLRWPVLVLNILMSIAALIVGSHYLVDILAGYVVASAAIWIASAAVKKSLLSSSQF